MQNHNATLDMDKWREIVEAWNKSNETQKAYCQRLGVSLNTFIYARTKLIRQDKPKAQFIPLTINSSAEKNPPSSLIVLEKPNGYKLHFCASLSIEQLTNFFKLSGWNDA